MRNLFLATTAAVIASASPALAVTPSITFTQGSFAATNPNAVVFQNFNAAPVNTQYVPTNPATESVSGNVQVFNNNTPFLGVDPDGTSGNNYLSIINGSYTANFAAAPLQYFSFVLGTLDSYNTLLLTFADGTQNLYRGQQIVGAADFGPLNSGTAGRVVYDFGGQSGLTSAVFASTQASFEIDAIITAVPEPTTWAMAMIGFGMVGGALRARRTRKVVFKTA